MYITVFLRIALYITLALMVYDYLRTEQLFIQLERGFIEEFSAEVVTWPGVIFSVFSVLLIVNIVIQTVQISKNKNSIRDAYSSPEYDVSDERTVEISQKSVSLAFSIILVYSFLILGSYMFVPNYFVDHIWYPMFTTASIPIVGLLIYLITYKTLVKR